MKCYEGRYKIFQFCESGYWRTRPTFELPDLLCSLPQNILIEFKKEQTKASLIDSDKIIDKGNGIFEVPSTVNPETEVRIVDMKVGRCSCIITKEKRIICRHLFKVVEDFGESHNYTIDDVDTEWFITIHQVNPTYDTAQTIDNNNDNSNSNDNVAVRNQESNRDDDINMSDKKLDCNKTAELPIPVS